MSLLQGALNAGRAYATQTFTESLQFFSRDGVVIDADTLNETHSETVLATVPGRIKYPSSVASQNIVSAQPITTQRITASVAVGATPMVAVDHFVRVITSFVDPTINGRIFRVTALPQSGQVTAHRYELEEQS